MTTELSVADDGLVRRSGALLVCSGLRLVAGDRELVAGAAFSVEAGCSLAVMGPSGSGKTTLLNCLAGLQRPAEGSVVLAGQDLAALNARERAKIRLAQIGMVFQFGELLAELTVGENVELPLRLRGSADLRAAAEALEAVGMGDRLRSRPAELSGGEVQRVAIARAVAGRPRLLLADEPTGALDDALSQQICRLMIQAAQTVGAALVVVTHDPAIAALMDERVRIEGSQLCVA